MGNLPITDQWVFDWLTSDYHVYVTTVLTIIAGVIHPILFGIYFYRKILKPTIPPNNINNADKSADRRAVSRADKSQSNANRSYSQMNQYTMDKNILNLLKRIIIGVTLCAILFGWIASILSLINILTLIGHPTTCQPFTILQNICWIFTKLCIYNIIIIRLQIAFSGSVYEYNHKILMFAYFFVNSICLVCIVGSIFDVDSIHFVTGWCLFIIPTWIILLPCGLDIVCSLFALYLFIKPLKHILIKNFSENMQNKKHNIRLIQISQLITKLILLTIIAVFSNLFGGIFFAVTDIAIFTYLDTLINPICLVLMENVNRDIYKIFCKYCHIKLHLIVHYKNDIIKTKPFPASVAVVEKSETGKKQIPAQQPTSTPNVVDTSAT